MDQEAVPMVRPLPVLNFHQVSHGWETERAVEELSEHFGLWSRFTLRQDYAGSAHQDTQTIFLRGPPDTRNIFNTLDCIDYPYSQRLVTARQLAECVSRELSALELGRIMVVKLAAGGRIARHVDEGAYAEHHQRYHLVLTSSPQCRFYCGNENVSMQPGELWWFDHRKPHWVINDGPARIHLIVDLKPVPGMRDTDRRIDSVGIVARD